MKYVYTSRGHGCGFLSVYFCRQTALQKIIRLPTLNRWSNIVALKQNIEGVRIMNNTMIGVDLAKEVIRVCIYTNQSVHSNKEMTHDDFLLWLFTTAASHGERTRGLVVPRRRRAVVLSESER